MFTILVCIGVISFCTLTAMGVAVYSHFTRPETINGNWIVAVVAGMFFLLGIVIVLLPRPEWLP